MSGGISAKLEAKGAVNQTTRNKDLLSGNFHAVSPLVLPPSVDLNCSSAQLFVPCAFNQDGEVCPISSDLFPRDSSQADAGGLVQKMNRAHLITITTLLPPGCWDDPAGRRLRLEPRAIMSCIMASVPWVFRRPSLKI
jgi:hypothetical protein